jgi:hypothetical protein
LVSFESSLKLDFLYFGDLKLTGQNEIKEMLKLTKQSNQNYSTIKEICHFGATIDSDAHYYSNMLNALRNIKEYPDIEIDVLDYETGEVLKSYPLHKLFLLRSPHIENILKSGMKESLENKIELSGISIETFEIIIHYLYFNEIQNISIDNVIEILVHCDIFQLKEIIDFSLEIVISHVNLENVLDLVSFSTIYNYHNLTSKCIHYSLKNDIFFDDEMIKKLHLESRKLYLELEKKKIRKNNKLGSQKTKKKNDMLSKALNQNNIQNFLKLKK